MFILPPRTLRWTVAIVLPFALSTLALADSGVGVDTWRANKLDPSGGQLLQSLDPNGTSWLEPGQHRSPTGNLQALRPNRRLQTLNRVIPGGYT